MRIFSVDLGGILIPNNYEALQVNQEFINILSYVESMREGYFKFQLTRILDKSENVLQLIKDELIMEWSLIP